MVFVDASALVKRIPVLLVPTNLKIGEEAFDDLVEGYPVLRELVPLEVIFEV